MLVETHKLIANTLLDHIEIEEFPLIKSNYFLWGNIKPDCFSVYKFKKHYEFESFNMIINKCNFLASLNIDTINYLYRVRRFNQELGVICHFICDFFCRPHYERWEFKSPKVTKQHIMYERELSKFAKDFCFQEQSFNNFRIDEMDEFLRDLLEQYKDNNDYENDLKYAYFACYNVINSILASIVYNTYANKYVAVVV